MKADSLRQQVQSRYDRSEYPALHRQAHQWRATRPLAGLRVLDATPVFANTLTKYLALLEAGADLVVSPKCGIPADSRIVAAAHACGIEMWDGDTTGFDVVCDCAGTHRQVDARLGYVELTRSGAARYADCLAPVFLADAGRVKRIETTLGTGDGWLRAMNHLGHPVPTGASVVTVGVGKVGHGVALAAHRSGADVTLVDPVQPGAGPGRWVHTNDPAVTALLRTAWCVVAATGIGGALGRWHEPLLAGEALLANMGAEDEFGPEIPAERVLNSKIAVNFCLDEPTRLAYLDPTMALSNAGVLALLNGDCAPGLNDPPVDLEGDILAAVRHDGVIGDELDALLAGRPSDDA